MVYQNYEKLKKIRNARPVQLLVYSFFLVLPLSCKSTGSVPSPEKFYAGRSGFALMAEGAGFYITAEVQSVRPILDSLKIGGMTGAELKQFLDMSNVLTAAVFEAAGGRRFYAAALGSFPTGSGLFFSASKDWEKRTSALGMPYWYSQRSQLSVSLNAKVAYLSHDDPFVPPPGAAVPEALPALQKGAVLSGWMNDPAPAINRFAAGLGVPIEIPAERLVFAVYPAGPAGKGKQAGEEQYTAVLRFETPTSTQAAALVRIFTLAKIGLAMADFSGREDMKVLAGAFFSGNPQAEGSALILTTGTMNGTDLALLFNAISIY